MSNALILRVVFAAAFIAGLAWFIRLEHRTRLRDREPGTPPWHPEAGTVLDDEEQDWIRAVDHELWGGKR